ncbi:MAG: hypothetical protein JO280_03875 [Mycobacteriaceae bacterium]|nr:hypothetical protein [Mycobacteriaceae bacterium]
MGEVIKGSEAIATGRLTGWALRRWYRPIFRDVYVPKQQAVTLRDRTLGAWLWSKRGAVITGVAASALHGANWVDADVPIELRLDCTRPPHGIVARNTTLLDDELTHVGRLPVTTPARTAFDMGRFLPRGQALARLDALMRATPFSIEDVLVIAKRRPGARGIRQLRELLPLVDGGAASPKETWLRLLLIDAGLPKPTTQIPVATNGHLIAMLDMGWEDFQVAAEYDGDQHRTDRKQYVKDLRRIPEIQRRGWIFIRVIAEDRETDIIERVQKALTSRGWRPQNPPRR